ncbi:hypothetical protein [Pseudoxanthomonas kaohsiungensis]|uniref:Uncharacterized protein n=1 Tax=Pseudoxanthomonas kaohsiungensis TaxID=283923 RepID=A0ABW3LZB4_9GAMM|nr:hypothetical protein [Pseudoxanthomonas kaohsiungensis]
MNANASQRPPKGPRQACASIIGITTITATGITRPVRSVVFV